MLGYLDDLIIVPLGILLAVKLVPPELMSEFRAQAAQRAKPVSIVGLLFVVMTWTAAASLVALWLWPDPG